MSRCYEPHKKVENFFSSGRGTIHCKKKKATFNSNSNRVTWISRVALNTVGQSLLFILKNRWKVALKTGVLNVSTIKRKPPVRVQQQESSVIPVQAGVLEDDPLQM